MLKRKNILIVFTVFLLITAIFSFISNPSEINYINQNNAENPKLSANLEGAENVLITNIARAINISIYDLMQFRDLITIKNLNNNPITSFFIAIPLEYSENLIFLEATGNGGNTLLTERSYIVMDVYEMIAIYFDSPLLPQQITTVIFRHTYKNLLSLQIESFDPQTQEILQGVSFTGYLFPLLPYKSEKNMRTVFDFPDSGGQLEASDDWGSVIPDYNLVIYDLDYIESELGDNYIKPFLENLGDHRYSTVHIVDNSFTRLEAKEIMREIFISPWGIIRVKESFLIKNEGLIDLEVFSLKLPKYATNVYLSDDLGEILNAGIDASGLLTIILGDYRSNRVPITPQSSFKFNLLYYLPFEKFYSLNWFQESIQIDILTTKHDFLGRDQTVKIVIDGCSSIDDVTEAPDAIKKSKGNYVLYYKSDYVTPLETKTIQFTFTIDLFDLLLRPIVFIIVILSIASIYVLIIKTRKREYDSAALKKEFIPIDEIREFCSLYEEKNALFLEIKQAEDDAKRKKMAKKKYKNILDKNTGKIDEIEKEIIPFKKTLMEVNETFETIIKRLDVLEAERISVKDSLNLLETRYKRGRLPSRAAYLKLSDDFKKRGKKIDRNIDKFIQQLRSYLL
ncbi:MAG: hypothetical protein ACFE9T_12770 [Promethearchaeota archaeon]